MNPPCADRCYDAARKSEAAWRFTDGLEIHTGGAAGEQLLGRGGALIFRIATWRRDPLPVMAR